MIVPRLCVAGPVFPALAARLAGYVLAYLALPSSPLCFACDLSGRRELVWSRGRLSSEGLVISFDPLLGFAPAGFSESCW